MVADVLHVAATATIRPQRRGSRGEVPGCGEDVLPKPEGAWKMIRRTIVPDIDVLLDKNLSVFL
jgi:hypothetical protein